MLILSRLLASIFAAVFMLSLSAAPSSAAEPDAAVPSSAAELSTDTTDFVSTSALMRNRWFCRNDNTKVLNTSYQTGTITTRIYANNHCGRTVNLEVHWSSGAGTGPYCWKIPPGKSNKLITHGLGGKITSLRFMGC